MKVYALSDQHGYLNDLQLPEDADLILHAGDVCPDIGKAQSAWIKNNWLQWRGHAPLFGTFGNHDWVDVNSAPSCFFVNEVHQINGLAVYFSPFSNRFGAWSWMADPEDLAKVYGAIPEGIDILVSHQPPYGYGDKLDPRYLMGEADPHVGSKELLEAIDRVKPKVVICGHIHSGYGVYNRNSTVIYNVAVVNEEYKVVRGCTEIPL